MIVEQQPGVDGSTKKEVEKQDKNGVLLWVIKKHPALAFSILTLLAGTGVVLEAYQNIPQIREGIGSLSSRTAAWWKSLALPENWHDLIKLVQGEKFTNKEASGFIGPNNTLPVTLEEANTVLENMKRAGLADETTLLFPLKFPEGSNGVSYEFQERSTGFNPETGKPEITNNKNWLFLFNVPKGTEILAPVDGIIDNSTLYSGNNKSLTGLKIWGIAIEFTIDGIEYRVGIASLGDRVFTLDNSSIPDIPGRQQTPIKRGQRVMTLNEDNITMQISYRSTPIGSKKNLETPVGIIFLTATDNKSTEKLLVPKN